MNERMNKWKMRCFVNMFLSLSVYECSIFTQDSRTYRTPLLMLSNANTLTSWKSNNESSTCFRQNTRPTEGPETAAACQFNTSAHIPGVINEPSRGADKISSALRHRSGDGTVTGRCQELELDASLMTFLQLKSFRERLNLRSVFMYII